MSNNEKLQVRKDNAIAAGQGTLYSAYIERAKNSELWDVDGNRYIDFGAGIAVCNTGHSHPKLVKAVGEQMARFSHTCVMVNPYESAVLLAERLNTIAPGETTKKSMFVSTGAEAVENAVKIARAYTLRRGIIAFNGGFHGRTNLTMGLTGKITPYKDKFGPFPNEIYHVPFPSPMHGVTEKDSLNAINNLFKVDIAPSDVAALIIEPIQGEGGFYEASPTFLQKLRKLCNEHGIVLICDEIQSGFARTGKMFCTEYSGIEPDLITMAKGIAGGVPLSAVVGKHYIMDASPAGGLGGTYGGSPLAIAAALAVLEVISEERLIERAQFIETHFRKYLEPLKLEFPHLIGDIRGKGAMMALELVTEGNFDRPNVELTKAIIAEAKKHGLVLLACGFYGNVIRFLPPLTIEEEILIEGLNAFEHLFKKIAGELQ